MSHPAFKISFKAEGVVVAESDIPGITAERVEQVFRDTLREILDDELEVDADWVKSHHFDVTAQVTEVSQ